MAIPPSLQTAIAGLSSSLKLSELARELSSSYRGRERDKAIQNESLAKAYLVTRFPATFAAVTKVLELLPTESIESLLDVGAGPGTATWAGEALLPTLKRATLVERNRFMISMGKELSKHSALSLKWQESDLDRIEYEVHDLVIVAYVLGELSENPSANLIHSLWSAAGRFLVLIEPGTPDGFARIRSAREQLIALGAHVIAPCPHQKSCPMANGDWCHFAARVQRSSAHRQAKGGELNYEDEKFAYLIVGKQSHPLSKMRILRHPQKNKGHVVLKLCTDDGLCERTISKKNKELYKRARKAEWGDSLD